MHQEINCECDQDIYIYMYGAAPLHVTFKDFILTVALNYGKLGERENPNTHKCAENLMFWPADS